MFIIFQSINDTYVITRPMFSLSKDVPISAEDGRLDGVTSRNGDREDDSVRVRADRGDVVGGWPRQYAVVHTSRGGDPTNWGNLTRNMMSFIW